MRDFDIEGLCKYRYLMDINLKKHIWCIIFRIFVVI